MESQWLGHLAKSRSKCEGRRCDAQLYGNQRQTAANTLFGRHESQRTAVNPYFLPNNIVLPSPLQTLRFKGHYSDKRVLGINLQHQIRVQCMCIFIRVEIVLSMTSRMSPLSGVSGVSHTIPLVLLH